MMMHPYLTPEHVGLRERVRDFALEAIVPVARDLDERAEFPWDTVKALGEMGLLGIPVPREFGGMGLDELSYTLVVEELAKYDASHAITVSAHTNLGTSPILMFGTEEQKRRFVPPLASGEVLGGFGLTEPGAGSDASATRTRAVKVEGGYLLNGSKIFITHSGVGEIFTVTAVTDPERGAHGITSFIVCKPTVEPDRASDTRELLIEDAFVPDAQRLGDEGRGFINFMRTLDSGRIGVAALSLGLAEGAFEVAVRYANERRQFGRRIWDFQQVQFKLADMATDIQAGKHLTYHAAWLKEKGRPFAKEAAMAKLFCSELAMRATLDAIRLLGGVGYTSEYPVERMMRDAKVCEIGEGTSEVQRLVIARHALMEVLGDSATTSLSRKQEASSGIHTI